MPKKFTYALVQTIINCLDAAIAAVARPPIKLRVWSNQPRPFGSIPYSVGEISPTTNAAR